jgi:hypothetical protein
VKINAAAAEKKNPQIAPRERPAAAAEENHEVGRGQSVPVQFEAPVRKNALQVKKEIEMEENEMLEKEKAWEVPAFLRKQKK